MPNTLADITPKLLARALLALRTRAIMPQVVNGDYGLDAATYGKTIDVPIPSAMGAADDVTPGPTPPTPSSVAPTTVKVNLDQWKHKDFHLTDKEITQINRDSAFLPMQTSEAVQSIAETVNGFLHSLYVGIYGFVGTPGVTPFGAGIGEATAARKVLNQQRCPRDSRRGVLNFDAGAAALDQEGFRSAEKIGSSDVILSGEIGHKLGIDWYEDDSVKLHTKGTGTLYQTNGVQTLGSKVVAVDTGSGTFVVGDIVTFAGDTQTYVVTGALGAPGNLLIEPGLKIAHGDNVAITIKGSHVVNLVFHRDLIAFGNRPILEMTNDLSLGNLMLAMQDPISKLVLRVEVMRQYKQTVWDLDILYGGALTRAEYGVRIAA